VAKKAINRDSALIQEEDPAVEVEVAIVIEEDRLPILQDPDLDLSRADLALIVVEEDLDQRAQDLDPDQEAATHLRAPEKIPMEILPLSPKKNKF
jgi:hypothetical protein